MSLTVSHLFVSGAANGPDATKLRPQDWNATHVIAGGVPADVGLGNVENTKLSTWAGSSALTMLGTPIGAANTFLQSTGAAPTWSSFLFAGDAGSNTVGNFWLTDFIPPFSTATQNLFIGRRAGLSLTTGIGNLGIGLDALNSLTTGINNTAIGWDSQYANVSGTNNVSLGEDALKFCVGSNNTGVGYTAGYGNTGSYNVAIGPNSLYASGSGSQNVAVGYDALQLATSSSNTAVGYAALLSLVSGANNTAVGYQAGTLNTGSSGTFLGTNAGQANTGGNNVAIGVAALSSAGAAANSIAIGVNALLGSTGNDNVAIGYAAGDGNLAGTSNTFIGRSVAHANTGSGSVMIGYAAGYYETASNTLMIDNAVRSNQADARVKALIYGIFAATVAGQSLAFNANVTVTAGFGCNGAAAQTAVASGGALAAYGSGANGFDTGAHASALYALVVAMRGALVANGIMS